MVRSYRYRTSDTGNCDTFSDLTLRACSAADQGTGCPALGPDWLGPNRSRVNLGTPWSARSARMTRRLSRRTFTLTIQLRTMTLVWIPVAKSPSDHRPGSASRTVLRINTPAWSPSVYRSLCLANSCSGCITRYSERGLEPSATLDSWR